MPTTIAELNEIADTAAAAAPALAPAAPEDRVRWLEAVADALDLAAPQLIHTAATETHLDELRLTGEIARTTGQLRLFASMIRDGAYLEATIDHAEPHATPPRPDLRRLLIPVGPVAVFAASNFPFAFSVAGGDTASALAVGCPVIVKTHEGHPKTSALTARVAIDALRNAGAPDGTLAIVSGREAGVALVQHPAIKAASFTGSVAGGRALFDLAAGRPEPIPFYGELGSINPVVISKEAVKERGDELAQGLVGSFTLGAGQYCTKPGVVFVPDGAGFEQLVANALPTPKPKKLLTPKIAESFARDTNAAAEDSDLTVIAGDTNQQTGEATSLVFTAPAAAVTSHPEKILAERFGPATVLVTYASADELQGALTNLDGSLTGTVHAQPGEDITDIVDTLASRVGRLLFAGWPTGVSVAWSQQHGGPWPATTSLHTSVGMSAARRFQRPLAYQDAPDELLPDALRELNPLRIPRRVDGTLGLPK